LTLPSVLRGTLPAAGIVAVLYALAKLAGGSETVVLQAAGASPWRLTRPILAFGILVGLLSAVLGHLLVPLSLERLNARQAAIAETATARLLRPGEFISPQSGLTIYVQEVTSEGELQGLLISDRRDPRQGVMITATSAHLVKDAAGPSLVLGEGLLQQLGTEDRQLLTSSFAELTYDLGALLSESAEEAASSRQLTTPQLLRPTDAILSSTGKSAETLRAEAHERMAESLMPPSSALIGLGALLLGQFSRFGLWRQVTLAVALVILVELVEGVVVSSVRENAALWPMIYIPPTFGAALGTSLLWLSTWSRRFSEAHAT
jgi:lipopolysaccharide export system permease protein